MLINNSIGIIIRKYLMNKQHKHKFTIVYYGMGKVPKVGLSCSCGERKERDATKREIVRFKRRWKKHNKQCRQMHHVWHEFCRKFSGQGGYELSIQVAKWARKYPKDVFVCSIDDDCHMGSDIVFILHRIGNRNWGTTVVVIPQCENIYHSYFMYPSHLSEIVKILAKINKMKGLR